MLHGPFGGLLLMLFDQNRGHIEFDEIDVSYRQTDVLQGRGLICLVNFLKDKNPKLDVLFFCIVLSRLGFILVAGCAEKVSRIDVSILYDLFYAFWGAAPASPGRAQNPP